MTTVRISPSPHNFLSCGRNCWRDCQINSASFINLISDQSELPTSGLRHFIILSRSRLAPQHRSTAVSRPFRNMQRYRWSHVCKGWPWWAGYHAIALTYATHFIRKIGLQISSSVWKNNQCHNVNIHQNDSNLQLKVPVSLPRMFEAALHRLRLSVPIGSSIWLA